MYVQTMDTLGTTSKGLNSQQLLQDNGLSKGINLMVDLNISQGRIEGLSESLESGEMEVQSKNSLVRKVKLDMGCISQRQEYVISNGDIEEVEGLHRQNLKDESNAPDQEKFRIANELQETILADTKLGIKYDDAGVLRMKKMIEQEAKDLESIMRNNSFAPLQRNKHQRNESRVRQSSSLAF
ncbi:hypothetical protein RHGRI_015195 [Rhododendron griersonianum]|uniref:Uncharacterized protein n=1 Tax=Rhododendron griersonianum TaxID=479676 RepID=A0AAV6KCW2_9ERIC|nr:hypothetical protein RHGRI_015195 [Rhododendron griersonianum]